MPLPPRHQLLARLGEDYEHKGSYAGDLSVEAKLDMDRLRLRHEKGLVHGVGFDVYLFASASICRDPRITSIKKG